MKMIGAMIAIFAAPLGAAAQDYLMAGCIPALSEATNVGEITEALEAARNDPEAKECLRDLASNVPAIEQQQAADDKNDADALARAEAESAMMEEQQRRAANP